MDISGVKMEVLLGSPIKIPTKVHGEVWVDRISVQLWREIEINQVKLVNGSWLDKDDFASNELSRHFLQIRIILERTEYFQRLRENI